LVRARWFLVAILTLALPMHAAAATGSDLRIAFGDQETRNAPAHDHAAHDHVNNDASDAVHCEPCAMAFIPAAPKLCIPSLPQASIVAASAPWPDTAMLPGLDRPPLAS